MKTKAILVFSLVFFVFLASAQSSFKVEVKGKGKPVLLFPGFGCPGEAWNDAVAELSKKYQCHIFTFAGFGKVAPIDGPWLPTIQQEVIAYVKKNKLKNATLVGHSLGGTLSLSMAVAEPDLFRKVIAVDALPCSAALMIPNYKGEPLAYDNPRSKMMLQMDSASFATMNQQTVPYMCKNEEKQKLIAQWMNQTDRKTYVYGYIDMLNLDLREAIAKIKVPVIVLGAANPDKATVEKTYQAQFAKLPGTVMLYAENSAHFIMFDQPQWLLEKLNENLK